MAFTPDKLNWKLATTVGAITGVAVGGFVMAEPAAPPAPPAEVILDDAAPSAPRLSAPVVVPTTTAAQFASAASIRTPLTPASPLDRQVTAPSPAIAPVTSINPPVTIADVDSPASPADPIDVDSPDTPVEVDSPASPATPADVDTPASPATPADVDSPVSPATPAEVDSPASPASVDD